MATTVLSDPADPRLDGYRDLRDPDLRRASEDTLGLFVAEGLAVVARLLESPYPVVSVAVTPERLGALEHAVGAPALADRAVLVVARPVLDAVVGFPVHRGVLALGRRLPVVDVDAIDADVRTVLVLEDGNDHENLGAMARSARALGVDALVLSPRCADPLYRRSVRVSMGEVLRLRVHRASMWPAGLVALQASGFRVLALTPGPKSVPLDAVVVGAADRVAVVVGAEGPGLSVGALGVADQQVRIPIAPGVDSLNVGHAAAIALHHVAASRRADHPPSSA